jgi:hypothetical protein
LYIHVLHALLGLAYKPQRNIRVEVLMQLGGIGSSSPCSRGPWAQLSAASNATPRGTSCHSCPLRMSARISAGSQEVRSRHRTIPSSNAVGLTSRHVFDISLSGNPRSPWRKLRAERRYPPSWRI